MVTHSVNKTALHPGGVEYVAVASTGRLTSLTRCCRPSREHTELEEELHTTAHIDYDRVAIVDNPSVSALYEDALVYETGSAITSSGALTAYSGSKTGRSPLDKRVVKEESSEKDVWWGPVNKPMSPEVSTAHFTIMAITLFYSGLAIHPSIHPLTCQLSQHGEHMLDMSGVEICVTSGLGAIPRHADDARSRLGRLGQQEPGVDLERVGCLHFSLPRVARIQP